MSARYKPWETCQAKQRRWMRGHLESEATPPSSDSSSMAEQDLEQVSQGQSSLYPLELCCLPSQLLHSVGLCTGLPSIHNASPVPGDLVLSFFL